MDIFRGIEEMLNSGDELVRTWFLVGNNYLPIVLCTCYFLFSTVIGPAIMKNRKPFNLRKTMIAFNFTIVAVYLYVWIVMIVYLPQISYELFCKGDILRKGTITYTLTSAGWVLYVVKYAEFFDTVFFVLRKKNNLITFLHVVHHSLIPLAGWIIMRTERSGFQAIPCLINGFVHIFMYTYYGLAAMGPEVRKYLWWKKYLTQLQMIQFILIIGFITIVAPMSGCSMVGTSYLLDAFIAGLFLVLFYKFYQANYVSRKTPNARPEIDVTATGIEKNGGSGEVASEKQSVANGRSKKD